MFEKRSSEPVADGGEGDEGLEAGAEFFIARGDGPLFLDALKEVLHLMAAFVVPLVMAGGPFAVCLGRNAGLESASFQESSELVTVIRLVRQDRPAGVPFHQIGGAQEVVPMPRAQYQPQCSALGVHQCMDLGVGPAPALANGLIFRAPGPAMGLFVRLDAGRIHAPQPALGRGAECLQKAVPETALTPLFPSGVDRRVGSENAQRPPGTPFAQPEEQRLKDGLQRNGRTARLFQSSDRKSGSTATGAINFFSFPIARASAG